MLVGVLGAGQLGRMLAIAGAPMGLRFRFFDPSAEPCAAGFGEIVRGEYADLRALQRFAAGLDVVTYEFENVPVESARHLAGRMPTFPPPQALEVAQDRVREKEFFRSLGLGVPAFAAADGEASLAAVLASIGPRAVIKTRRMGYDGKGQVVVDRGTPAQGAARAWEELAGQAAGGGGLIVESLIDFEFEAAIVAARGRGGEIAFYPLTRTTHKGGILRLAVAPLGAIIDPARAARLEAKAQASARAVLERLGYVGVLAIEFFVKGEELIANEMAPRVHNSGHWTIEGAQTSQFANHMRAVAGWPLGSTRMLAPVAAMINIIGVAPPTAQLLAVPGTAAHDYGKSPRPGRKVGHATLLAESWAAAAPLVDRLGALVAG